MSIEDKTPSLEKSVDLFKKSESFDITNLATGEKLEITTENTVYVLEKRGDGFYLSGNPDFCPKPTKAYINGSTMGGSSIKVNHVVNGGHLEFSLPDRGSFITSQIQDFRKVE